MADGVRANKAGYGSIGAVQGVCLCTMTGPRGATLGLHLQTSVSKVTLTGNPAQPCLGIYGPGIWRFRWQIRIGVQTISISVLQATNTNPRPTMTLAKNTDVGLNADLVGTAPSSSTWCTIGPLAVTGTAQGVIEVELRNNKIDSYDWAYFDNIIAT